MFQIRARLATVIMAVLVVAVGPFVGRVGATPPRVSLSRHEYVTVIRPCPKYGDNQGVFERVARRDAPDIYDILQTEPFSTLGRLWHLTGNMLAREEVEEEYSEGASMYGHPAYVYPWAQPGGYARFGLSLIDGESVQHHPTMFYAEIRGTSRFSLEQVFLHELGHGFVNYLFPEGAAYHGPSSRIHEVNVVTDFHTAFDEGFAIHLQAVAADISAVPSASDPGNSFGLRILKRAADRYRREYESGVTGAATIFMPIWFEMGKMPLRVEAVRDGRFAARFDVPGDRFIGNPARLFNVENVVALSNPDAWRNASQILSCEGAVAHVLYEIVTSEEIQTRYLDPGFYAEFLSPGQCWPTDQDPAEMFSPLENAYLKLFRAMRLARDEDAASPLIATLRAYAQLSPEDSPALYRAVVHATGGVTASAEAGLLMNRLMVDLGCPVAARREAGPALDALADQVISGDVAIDAALGPELWLLDREIGGSIGIWDVFGGLRVPQAVNLNAASAVEAASVFGFDLETSQAVLDYRDRSGYIGSLEELRRDGVVDEALFERIREMEADMDRLLASGSSMAEIILAEHSQVSALFAMIFPNVLRLLGGWGGVLLILAAGSWLLGGMPDWSMIRSSMTVRKVIVGVVVSITIYFAVLLAPPSAWHTRMAMGGAAGAAISLVRAAVRRRFAGSDTLRDAVAWGLGGAMLLLLIVA